MMNNQVLQRRDYTSASDRQIPEASVAAGLEIAFSNITLYLLGEICGTGPQQINNDALTGVYSNDLVSRTILYSTTWANHLIQVVWSAKGRQRTIWLGFHSRCVLDHKDFVHSVDKLMQGLTYIPLAIVYAFAFLVLKNLRTS